MKEVVAHKYPVQYKVRKRHSCNYHHCLSISYIANKNPTMSIQGSFIFNALNEIV